MADFAQFRDTSRPEASAVRPTEAVADTTTATLLQGISKTMGAVSDALGAGKASAADTAARQYIKSQTDLVNQLGSGQISEAEKAAKQRLNYQKALDAGVIPTDDLRKYTKDFLDLGSNEDAMSEEAKRWKSSIDAGVKDGFVDIDASYEEQKQQASDYAKMQAQVTKSQAMMTNINATEAQRKQAQKDIIREAYPVYTDKSMRDAQKIVNQVRSGQLSTEDGVQALNDLKTQVANFATQLGPDAAEYGNSLIAPINMQIDNALKVVDGSQSADILQTKIKRTKALAEAKVWDNPRIAKLAALSNVFPNSDILTTADSVGVVTEYITSLESGDATRVPDITDPENASAIKDSLQGFKDVAIAYSKGEAGDEAKQSVTQGINGVIRSVAVNGISVDNPTELNNFADFISSDSIGRIIAENGGISSDYAADAETAYREMYVQPAVQSVLKDFQTGTTNKFPAMRSLGGDATAPSESTGQSIEVQYTGTGVRFVPAEGNTSPGVRMKVKQLNSKSAKLLNRLIRGSAHLQGTTDYKKVWEEQFMEQFVPEQPTEEQPTTSAAEKPTEAPKEAPSETPKEERMKNEVPSLTRLPKEMVAKLDELKAKGYTKDQMLDMLGYLDLKPNSGTGVDMYAAIEQVYNQG